jgi:hypothetical protein
LDEPIQIGRQIGMILFKRVGDSIQLLHLSFGQGDRIGDFVIEKTENIQSGFGIGNLPRGEEKGIDKKSSC